MFDPLVLTVLFAVAVIIFSILMTKLSWIAILAVLIPNAILWLQTGFPPFIGGRGSLVFFGALIVIKAVLLGNIKTAKLLKGFAAIMFVVFLFLPDRNKEIQAVLATVWLGIHVPLFFLGYLSLAAAFFFSFSENDNARISEKRELRLALFFLMAGLVTGAIWAELAWGRFWGWDAKEVWALATWLFAAAYFHMNTRTEEKICLYASCATMLATYFAVTWLLPGMHAYG